jgi:hypothetical protein
VNDDIYFCLSEDGTTGYFLLRALGGLGAQDIYQVLFPHSQIEYVAVLGVVTDNTEEPVRARMTVMDQSTDEIIGVYTRERQYRALPDDPPPGGKYRMTIEAQGFETREAEVLAIAPEGTREMPLDIILVRNDQTARAINPE